MANKRIIWKHRQAMVEKAARIEIALVLVKGEINGLGKQRRDWFEAHINQYAAFEIGNVEPSNMQRIEAKFWQDVVRVSGTTIREYNALPKPAQVVWLESIKRQVEPATAQPAKSAAARLVVSESVMASVTAQDAPKSSVTGKAAFLASPDDFSAKFRQIEIEGNLTLVPVGSSIANAIDKQAVKLPTAPIVVDVKADPHEAAANQRRAEFRQRRLWAEYDSGTLEAIDFCPELPPAPEVPKVERQHVYDGRYYGSYSYYSRNR